MAGEVANTASLAGESIFRNHVESEIFGMIYSLFNFGHIL
jgi:hypothetical protein